MTSVLLAFADTANKDNMHNNNSTLRVDPRELREGMLFCVKPGSNFYCLKCTQYPLDTWGWDPPEGWSKFEQLWLGQNEVLMLLDIDFAIHQAQPVAKSYVYLVFQWKEQKVVYRSEYNQYENRGIDLVGLFYGKPVTESSQ